MSQQGSYPLKWITEQLAVGYAPRSQRDIDAIKNNHIDAILNLCAECYDLHKIEAEAGFLVHWLPISDEDAPELDEAQEALAWLDTMMADGKKVLVHCRFGIGRTGTMAVAWLVSHGHTVDDALDILDPTPACPTSRRQWDFLNALSTANGKTAIPKASRMARAPSRLGKFFRKYLLMQHYRED